MRRSVLDNWIQQKEEIAELNRASIEEMQLKKINALFARVKEKSAYYSYLPGGMDSLADMQAVALLSERQLTANHRQMLLLSQSRVEKVITMYSSATTGQAKRLFFSEEDIEKTVDFFACGLREIATEGDRCLVWMPANAEHSVGALIARALERINVAVFSCSLDETFDALACLVEEKKINCAVAMPFKMLSLMRYADKIGKSLPLKSVLISADSAPPFLKKELDERFSLHVIEHYGLSESGLGGAVECGDKSGMHIRENDLLIEITDEKGNWVRDGQEGEIVLTTLCHEAMPLIRYRTGDKGKISAQACACGSTLKKLQNVRREAVSNEMSPLDAVLFTRDGVLDYRVARQEKRVTIDIVLTDKADREVIEKELEYVILQKGWGVNIEIHWHTEKWRRHAPYYTAKRKIMTE